MAMSLTVLPHENCEQSRKWRKVFCGKQQSKRRPK